MKLYSRIKGLLVRQNPIFSPDGREFYYKGKWHAVPGGAAVDMIQGNSRWHCDFLGPTGTNDTMFQGSSRGAHYAVANGATVAVLGINGGAARMTIDGSGDNDAAAVYGPLAYEPDESRRIWMQARFRSDVVATLSLFLGFTDAITDTVVIEDEDGTLNTVATDAFGLLLEGEQDGTWQTMGVGNDVDDTQFASSGTGTIPDLGTSTWTTVHIEADSGGNAARTVVRYRVFVDGVLLTTTNTDTAGWTASVARSSIVFAPVVSADSRAATFLVDIAEMAADGGTGASFD